MVGYCGQSSPYKAVECSRLSFSLLCLPIGTVVKLLGNNDMLPFGPLKSALGSRLLSIQEGLLNTSSGISSFLLAAELDNEDDEEGEDMEEDIEG
ncbi:hypothetical protein L195_g046750 [Trifolium pratense]|uniref:Uncharacterized protein n=1 Tax=Trifolium pratense TaxID=57577 RepID=A0A2K3MIK1_TRIPR|nr:hypothetical protein L195_g046750 [Trifolium pratense]